MMTWRAARRDSQAWLVMGVFTGGFGLSALLSSAMLAIELVARISGRLKTRATGAIPQP